MASDAVAAKYLFRTPTNRRSGMPKVIVEKAGQLQADVMYLVSYGAWTGGYKYCLNVIEGRSRFAWSFPMKKLTKRAVKEALVGVIDELVGEYGIPIEDVNVTSDQGTEFSHSVGTVAPVEGNEGNEELNEVELPVPHTVIHPSMGKGRTVLVERFNRTLHNRLRDARFKDPHNRSGDGFVAILKKCVSEYNDKKHGTTKVSPRNALKGVERVAEVLQNDVEGFNPGDAVLVVRKLDMFEKRSNAVRWNPELWKVTGQIGWRYTLEPWGGGEEFEDKYGYNPLGSELQLVKPGDVERYLAYEKPKQIVMEQDREKVDKRQAKAFEKAWNEMADVGKRTVPTSSVRKGRVNYASFK